ncbi:hypothetical protein LB504_009501 [Fusarium proliferatum]|nr:hypothetical protein LB504_009501 [Fusarium proliferatum]
MSKRVFEPHCNPQKKAKKYPHPDLHQDPWLTPYTVIGVQRVNYYSIRAFVCFNRSTTKSFGIACWDRYYCDGLYPVEKRGRL